MKLVIFFMLIMAIKIYGNSLKNLKEEKTTTSKPKTEERTSQPTFTSHDDSVILDADDVQHIELHLDHLEKIKKKYLKHDKRVLVKGVHNLFACLNENSEIHDCVKIR